MTNTDAMAEFIQLVLSIPGFTGEILVADNHQAAVPDSRGWTTQYRNGSFNLNELIDHFQSKGHRNVTKYHWHPAGPNPRPLQMNGAGDSIRKSATDGDGYVWPTQEYYTSPYGNRCYLAYPTFTSAFSGTGIDFRKGAFEKGSYTGQPVKFINFSAINHHGMYAGATASIKNMMGVVDMSCGWPAPLPKGAYNTHHVGASLLFKTLSSPQILRLRSRSSFIRFYLNPSVFRFHYTGGVLGAFMREIRSPDLNIITAVRVGWGSRTDPEKSAYAHTICASTDPVALDAWATRHILLPLTIKANASEGIRLVNDPDRHDGPLYRFLHQTQLELGGTLEEERIQVAGKLVLPT